tara:strand:- start:25 stop:432 length:408 start_codon:yes stop_codon:yes gene_type:complete
MSKNKQQGTAFETWTRKALNALDIKARRIAEGGANDEGDVEAHFDERWVIECKATSALNVQQILGKARRKAGGAPVILVWKRLVRVAGKQTRQPVSGERVVVVLGWEDFVRLITKAEPTAETEFNDNDNERNNNV